MKSLIYSVPNLKNPSQKSNMDNFELLILIKIQMLAFCFQSKLNFLLLEISQNQSSDYFEGLQLHIYQYFVSPA